MGRKNHPLIKENPEGICRESFKNPPIVDETLPLTGSMGGIHRQGNEPWKRKSQERRMAADGGGWRRMAADGGGIDWMDPKTEEAGKEGSGGRK